MRIEDGSTFAVLGGKGGNSGSLGGQDFDTSGCGF